MVLDPTALGTFRRRLGATRPGLCTCWVMEVSFLSRPLAADGREERRGVLEVKETGATVGAETGPGAGAVVGAGAGARVGAGACVGTGAGAGPA